MEKSANLPKSEQGRKGKKGKYVRKNQYRFDVRKYLYQLPGTDLTAAEGMDEKMLLDVISVTGIDMSKWPTEKHFTSWLNLSPRRMKTGGQKIRLLRLFEFLPSQQVTAVKDIWEYYTAGWLRKKEKKPPPKR